ncbi:MAG TPA: exosortase-associated EpsI family protein [Tepidisphaeraceae bacterium]|jgi:hypothetical protein
MADPTNQLRLLLTGPVLCAVLLSAMVADNRHYRTEEDYADYHRRAASAINRIPLSVGPWIGREEPLSKEELGLLQPNAYRCVSFTDTRPTSTGEAPPQVLLLVAQCRRAGLMEGHYPPVCYPSRGYAQVNGAGTNRQWTVGRQRIVGMEYFFERRAGGRVGRTCVYNFMVLPQQGIRPDMESVGASAEDYQQRYYGAAQFQLVFGGGLARATPEAREQRDAAFAELIGPCSGVIATLCDGVNTHE